MALSGPIRHTTADERALLLRRIHREAFWMGLFTVFCAATTAGFGFGFVHEFGDAGLMAVTGLMAAVMLFVTGLMVRTVRRSLTVARALPPALPVRVLHGPMRMGQRPPRTIDWTPFYLVGRWPRGAGGWDLVRAEGCLVPPPPGEPGEGPFVAFALEELSPDDTLVQ